MSTAPRRSSHLATWLFAIGAILILAGAITALAAAQPYLEAPPASYGEVAPPVIPTVTALPGPGQAVIPSDTVPVGLPETPLELPTQAARPAAPRPRPTELPRNPAERVPTRLVIPAIELDAPVETVGWHVINGASQWDVPEHFAAGWLKTSAPLGQVGNTVLDGHHNIAGEVFRRLVDLKIGDTIIVHAQGGSYAYEVTTRHILPERDQPYDVRVKNAQWIQPTKDERLTLVTCWPYSNNTHRLIIVAQPSALEPDVTP